MFPTSTPTRATSPAALKLSPRSSSLSRPTGASWASLTSTPTPRAPSPPTTTPCSKQSPAAWPPRCAREQEDHRQLVPVRLRQLHLRRRHSRHHLGGLLRQQGGG